MTNKKNVDKKTFSGQNGLYPALLSAKPYLMINVLEVLPSEMPSFGQACSITIPMNINP